MAISKKVRQFKGEVVSDKMNKTIVVVVSRTKKHLKYQKRYKVSKKYKVHDSKNEFKKGDKVLFRESQPLSRGKRWQAVSKI